MRHLKIFFFTALALAFDLQASSAIAFRLGRPKAMASQTFDIVIGRMCIGGIPQAARRVTGRIQNGSDAFEEWSLTWLSQASGNKPIIRFFKGAAPIDKSASCRELTNEVVFDGEIKSIKLKARSSLPGNRGAARISIGKDEFDVVIGNVRSGLAPLFGGQLNLAGSKAWIRNHTAILDVADMPSQGSVEIETWTRTIKGAKFQLSSELPAQTVDLHSKSNITILAALDGEHTELFKGEISGHPQPITMESFALPAVTFQRSRVAITEILIWRKGETTSMRLLKDAVDYSGSTIRSRSSTVQTHEGRGVIEQIVSPLAPDAQVILLRTPTIRNATLKAQGCLGTIKSTTIVSSSICKTPIASAGTDQVEYRISAASITSLGFGDALLPGPKSVFEYEVRGSPLFEDFRGFVSDLALQLGAGRFSGVPRVNLPRASLLGETIKFPVGIDLPRSEGSTTFSSPEGQVVLSGRLDSLRLHAELILDAASLRNWILKIPSGQLSFDATGMVALQPLLFGSKPQFLKIRIAFASVDDISVDALGAVGHITFTPQLAAIVDPNVSLGRSKEGILFKAPASFDVDTKLSVDLHDASVSIESGRLAIGQAKAIVEKNRPATIGDIKIEDGDVSFDELKVVYHDGRGVVEVHNLQAHAARLSSVPREEGGTVADQLSWSGRAAKLLVAREIDGEVFRDTTAQQSLHFGKIVIKDTCSSVTDAVLGSGRTFIAHGRSLQVCAEIWSDEALRGNLDLENADLQFDSGDASGHIDVPTLTINILSGTPAKPSGTGSVVTHDLVLDANTPLELKQSCEGVPDFQAIQARSHVEVAAAHLSATLTDGMLTGAGPVAFARGVLQSTAQYTCNYRIINWKLWSAVVVKTDVPCPTWRDPLRFCMKEITVVPEGRVDIDEQIKVYSLSAGLIAVDPTLRLVQDDNKPKLVVCSGRLTRIQPVIAASYVFVPQTSVPGFNRFIGDLTGAFAAPFESVLLTLIGNTLSNGLSLYALFDVSDVCSK